MRILLLDIETAPNLAYVYGLWDQNVSLSQLVKPGYTLSWAAKWLGEKPIFYASIKSHGAKRMIREMHKLVSEAHAVIHYNGNRFDMPTLNKDFLLNGLPPPPPAKQIDLFRVVKSKFRFASNKLDHVCRELGLGGKVKHEGFELWLKCLNNDANAWKREEKYNKQDVVLLEKLYAHLKPWVKNINHGLYNPDNSEVCPKCGSETFQRRGMEHTSTCSYQRFQCCKCRGWFRGTRNIGPKPSKKFASL